MARISEHLDGESKSAVLAIFGGTASAPVEQRAEDRRAFSRGLQASKGTPGRAPGVQGRAPATPREKNGPRGTKTRESWAGRPRTASGAAARASRDEFMREVRDLSRDVARASRPSKSLKSAKSSKKKRARKDLAEIFRRRMTDLLERVNYVDDGDLRTQVLVLAQRVNDYSVRAGDREMLAIPLPGEQRLRGAQAPARALPQLPFGPQHTDYYDDPTLSK